jgi:hypothetical protein
MDALLQERIVQLAKRTMLFLARDWLFNRHSNAPCRAPERLSPRANAFLGQKFPTECFQRAIG